LAASVPI